MNSHKLVPSSKTLKIGKWRFLSCEGGLFGLNNIYSVKFTYIYCIMLYDTGFNKKLKSLYKSSPQRIV